MRPRLRVMILTACASTTVGLLTTVTPVVAVPPVDVQAEAADPVVQLLPDLGMRRIRDVALDVTSTPGVKKLRFTSIIVNAGEGRMEVTGTRSDTVSEMSTEQRIFNSDGTSITRSTPAKMYFAGDGHSHWHVRDLARYTLHRKSDGRTVRTQVKHGFCFYDNSVVTSSSEPYYTTCGSDSAALNQTMGLSPGWGDIYRATLPDQYIDVTNLATGTYRMRLKADADNWFTEANETNNGNWADVKITSTSATVVRQGGALF